MEILKFMNNRQLYNIEIIKFKLINLKFNRSQNQKLEYKSVAEYIMQQINHQNILKCKLGSILCN